MYLDLNFLLVELIIFLIINQGKQNKILILEVGFRFIYRSIYQKVDFLCRIVFFWLGVRVYFQGGMRREQSEVLVILFVYFERQKMYSFLNVIQILTKVIKWCLQCRGKSIGRGRLLGILRFRISFISYLGFILELLFYFFDLCR